MSLDANRLVRLVKQAAVEAIQAGAPVSINYGIVTSTDPLNISVDQKKILTKTQLILTDAVRDYTVKVSTPEGRKTVAIYNALQVGEKVILIRCDGGQQYIVLGRWEAKE